MPGRALPRLRRRAREVDLAVKAARKAFESWSLTSREERIAVLEKIATDDRGSKEIDTLFL